MTYAYVDESGNTGIRIFDQNQPVFITAAMITKTNFDAIRKNDLAVIARKVGAPALHANELGVARIEEIADDLLRVIKQSDARFFMSQVEKRYLAAAKVYDVFFDAGENLAVPWHVYWVRPLRLTMMFKLSHYVITDEIAHVVWDCVTAPSEAKSKACFIQAAQAMLMRVGNLPDERSRQIASEALQWALANPENFSTHLRDKINRNGHSPNFVAFSNLMDGLDKMAKAWKKPVTEIVHDQQSEFEKTLRHWHEVFSNPTLVDVDPPHWPGENEPITLSKNPGSKFRMATEETSPGLQVVDVVLWLFKRMVSKKDIGPGGARILNRVFQKGFQNDLSFNGVGDAVGQKMDEIWATPETESHKLAGAEMMEKSEQNRISAMTAYAAQKAAQTG